MSHFQLPSVKYVYAVDYNSMIGTILDRSGSLYFLLQPPSERLNAFLLVKGILA